MNTLGSRIGYMNYVIVAYVIKTILSDFNGHFTLNVVNSTEYFLFFVATWHNFACP